MSENNKNVQSEAEIDHVAVTCDSCDWTLTIAEVLEREEERFGPAPSARRIRSKFSSRAEGHAYFNRGHRTSVEFSEEDIERVVGEESDAR